jgi:iron complex transport system substrate-binding protein
MKALLIVVAVVATVCAGSASAARTASVPTRIVSLSPTATDDLFAVGAGKQVVAVDSLSTYPKQAPVTKLSAYSPNVEAIAQYRPDLVVIAFDENHVVEQLAKLHIRTLIQPAATNLAQVYAEIQQLGNVTGHAGQAKTVVAKMKKRIGAIVKRIPRPSEQLRVYEELDPTYYSVTSRTFIGQVYTLLGLKNIADGAAGASDYPQLSAEYIVASNPDLIVLADTVCCGQGYKSVAARPGWGTISAVKNHEVVRIDDSIASQWGTRVVNFFQAIGSAVKTLESRSA